MTITTTTTDLPATAAGRLPEDVGPARPDDAGSLRLALSWALESVWPGTGAPPWSAPAPEVQAWPACGWIMTHGGAVMDPGSREYSAAVAHRILRSLASAAAAVRVDGDDAPPGEHPQRGDAWDLIPPLHRDGHRVQLQSWEYLEPTVRNRWGEPQDGGIDTAALWRWAAADRAAPDGRRTAKQRDQALAALLPDALATAQAMHDALRLLLPQAIPQTTPTAPTPRRNQWR